MSYQISIELSQRKSDSNEKVYWKYTRQSTKEYAIQQIKIICLQLLYDKYSTWKRKRITNFDLREPIKFSIRINTKPAYTLMQKKYTKDDIIHLNDPLIKINKCLYLIRPFKLVKEANKNITPKEIDFNTKKHFEAIDYFNNIYPTNGSLIIYSSIESNRRKH